MYVTNLRVEDVSSPGQVATLLARARRTRAVAATNMNERSSRSHSVFQLRITGSNALTTESCAGTLNLVGRLVRSLRLGFSNLPRGSYQGLPSRKGSYVVQLPGITKS